MSKWLAIALVFACASPVYCFDIVRVSRDSMAGTYCDGDLLLAARPGTYTSLRGRAVVVIHPTYGRMLKRVIAEAGDRISVRDGITIVNGQEVAEPYLGCQGRLRKFDGGPVHDALADARISVVVPEGELYVLGDNRAASLDSRVFGTVSRQWVVDVIALSLLRRSMALCSC